MTITTRYNIGDEVWYLFAERIPNSAIVAHINISDTAINYALRNKEDINHVLGYFHKGESRLFPTKHALLDSLR